MLALAATVTVSACGSSKHFANLPRPAAPVNLTVYVNDQRVSVSPSSVGAGPVVFIITNQASNSESLVISPQGTAQLTVNLRRPGDYTVGISPDSSTEAAAATPTGIQSATIHVGSPRPSSSNEVGQP
jgi:hypothetical protein